MAARRGKRTLLSVAGAAVLALGAGLYAGTQLVSPADAADQAEAPDASTITVPVESRVLESAVSARADVTYAGAVDLTVEISGLQTPPVVTGLVPEVGATLAEATAILEVAGRPVIALVGELPMYRSLRPGMSGPDVAQLEATLDRLGFDPGEIDDEYTSATGAAVAELYEKVGYEAPEPDPEVDAELSAAEDQEQQAADAVSAAEQALAAVSGGAPEAERVAARNAVEAAERALDDAHDAGDDNAVAAAEDALQLAKAQEKDLLKGPDTSAEKSALDAAEAAHDDAKEQLVAAQETAGTPFPASEVAYVPSLPRRADEVNVKRGGLVDGAVMTVSGATLVLTAQVDEATRELLAEGQAATIALPTGDELAATVTSIAPTEDDGDEATDPTYDVVLTPTEPTQEQVDALRDANVKVTVPITSTEGDVLAVPVAAVTAGPGGESRVEVQRGEQTELVEVELGLTADGYVEVTPVEGTLAAGDEVVVGR